MRRAAHLNATGGQTQQMLQMQHVVVDPMSGQASSVLSLNAKFSELETLTDSHYHLTNNTNNPQSTSKHIFFFQNSNIFFFESEFSNQCPNGQFLKI
jgi:hypothetical protein